MVRNSVNRGISKSEWFEAALEALSEADIHSITIERLAERLGIAKSGFYWHFKSRDELLQELLDYWVREVASVFTACESAENSDARLRLLEATRKFQGDKLGNYERAVQQWAQHDKKVAAKVSKVNGIRLDFFRQALADLGITGDDAEMRAYLYVCSVTGQPQLPASQDRLASSKLVESRINFLTSTRNQ